MVGRHQLLALILLLAVPAFGQVITVTLPDADTETRYGTVGEPWYLRTIVYQGDQPMDLSSHRVSWTLRHVDTEALVLSTTGEIYRTSPGEVIFRWTPTHAAQFYSLAQIVNTNNGAVVATIIDGILEITSAPSASVSASVVITGAVAAVQEVTSGPPADFDYTSKILTLNTAFVGSGGSAIVSNVLTGGTNAWDAGTGTLTIDTNENLRSGSASINAQPLTNGASLTIASGGLQLWVETTGTLVQAGTYLTTTNLPLGQHRYGLFVGTNESIGITRPDNTITGGPARGVRAIDWQTERALTNQGAQAQYATISGGRDNRITPRADRSVIGGGQSHTISAQDATIAGGNANTVSGFAGAIGGGIGNSGAAQYGVIAGGHNNDISSIDTYQAILGGFYNRIRGDWAGSTYGGNAIVFGYEAVVDAAQAAYVANAYYSLTTNSLFSYQFGNRHTNLNSAYSMQLGGQFGRVLQATNVTQIGSYSSVAQGATNVVLIHAHGVTVTQNNWAVVGNIWISLVGTNNPPLTGAIAFANGNWRLAVSNQWRTPLYE